MELHGSPPLQGQGTAARSLLGSTHTEINAIQGLMGLRPGLVTAKIRRIVGYKSPSFPANRYSES